jgi:aspartyl-tRNA synthetase
MLRTHTCGDLNAATIGSSVALCGWIDTVREHANVLFVMLRDRYGIVQAVLEKSATEVPKLSRESVWRFEGEVRRRPPGTENPNLPTGEIEVAVTRSELIGACAGLPIDPRDPTPVSDELRLRYRYLDLRRPAMLRNLTVRHDVVRSIRRTLEDHAFIEVETPMFVRSTPEGSRDFVVPSRTFPYHFYALPQSPQLYKQLLMIAGVDRYFSFPRCFRDEDARRGRQLVHTQIDLEMSFVEEDDVYAVVEAFLARAFKEVIGVELPTPFPRHTYDECMERWGLDKPDARYGMELTDLSAAFGSVEHEGIRQLLAKGALAKAIVVPGAAGYSRKQVSELEDHARTYGLKALTTIRLGEEGLRSNLEKVASPDLLAAMAAACGAKPGDLVLAGCERPTIVYRALGELRTFLAARLGLVPEGVYRPLWVTDFPMFEYDEASQRWAPMHHMFTMPKREHLAFWRERPGDVRAALYDVVLNGIELGSGSVRITEPDLQREIMDFVGYPHEKAERDFGFFLNAYRYGAPRHAGIALGVDNLVMTMLGLGNIQDAIAFPNASSGAFPLDGSPSEIEDEQWRELHIRPDLQAKLKAAG